MSGGPQGWETTTLCDLFEFKYGKGLPAEQRNSEGSINVFGSNGVVGCHDSSVTSGPTIIVGRKGSVGEVHLSQQPCWPIDTTYFIDRFPADLPSKYWTFFLKSLRLGQQEKSSAIPGINRDDIYKIEVPLPPLNEQRRIVAKLDELLARMDASRQRLAKIPVILKRFRQAVLAAACSGRLTADWREENAPDKIVGAKQGSSASPDIGSDADMGEAGESLASPLQNGGKGEELPEGWVEIPLSDIASIIDPNPSHRYPSYENGTVPILATEQFSGLNDWDTTKAKLANMSFYEERKRAHGFMPDDIIFARKGRLGLARRPPNLERYTFSHTLFIIRATGEVDSSFLLWSLRRDACVSWLINEMNSNTGVPTLGKSYMERLPTPLPPLPEQCEIVRRVEALFTLADQLDARYEKAKAQVDKLTQSILAKAFRGELVPQDPADEPASVLLERIRAERAKSIPAPRSKAPRPTKKTYTPEPEPLPLAAEPAVAYGPTIPDRILSAMQPGRDYSRADVTVASGITDAEWLWAIRQLKEEGKVRQTGERRGARYRRA